MSKYSQFDTKIREKIKSGYRKFIICPFGEDGMLVDDILRKRYGIRDIELIDNYLMEYNDKIHGIEFLKDYNFNDDTILLFTSYNMSLYSAVCSIVEENKIINLLEMETIKPTIGKGTYGEKQIGLEKVESIGAFCSFAAGVKVEWNHPIDMVTTHEFMYASTHWKGIRGQKYTFDNFNKKVVIGNDVWLGRNVIITNGAKIGNGVIAGAGAVITKDIPDYAIVAGVPARIIRYRFTDEQINLLNKISWWDWPIEKIQKCYDDFKNIDIFLEKHGKV